MGSTINIIGVRLYRKKSRDYNRGLRHYDLFGALLNSTNGWLNCSITLLPYLNPWRLGSKLHSGHWNRRSYYLVLTGYLILNGRCVIPVSNVLMVIRKPTLIPKVVKPVRKNELGYQTRTTEKFCWYSFLLFSMTHPTAVEERRCVAIPVSINFNWMRSEGANGCASSQRPFFVRTLLVLGRPLRILSRSLCFLCLLCWHFLFLSFFFVKSVPALRRWF